MLHIGTAEWAHIPFDITAWSTSFILGRWLYRWRLRSQLAFVARNTGGAYFAALVCGAIIGAWLAGSLNSLRSPFATLSHSILGALAGAIIGVEIYKAIRGLKRSTGTIFVGPFAIGVAVGRLGCFFAGLPDFTYGTPTRLPWGVDLGDGVARHPVQLYESLSMLLFLLLHILALKQRRRWATESSFYLLAIWYGTQRFFWEFLKPYPSVVGPFNLFHLICLGVVTYGALFLFRNRQEDRPLSVPWADDQPVRDMPVAGSGQDRR